MIAIDTIGDDSIREEIIDLFKAYVCVFFDFTFHLLIILELSLSYLRIIRLFFYNNISNFYFAGGKGIH